MWTSSARAGLSASDALAPKGNYCMLRGTNDPLRRKALRAQTSAPLGRAGPLGREDHRCPPPSDQLTTKSCPSSATFAASNETVAVSNSGGISGGGQSICAIVLRGLQP